MYHQSCNNELSPLAMGRGFYEQGAEVECFIHDIRAYSLSGDPFLEPSETIAGQYAIPYRIQKLNLPKTYITKRGQLILFTAPEDMVIGKPCRLHRKKNIARNVVQEFKTTDNLRKSIMEYDNEPETPFVDMTDIDTSHLWRAQNWLGVAQDRDHRVVKAGHYLDVYVRNLHQVIAGNVGDLVVEDIEEKDFIVVDDKGDLHADMETPLIPECDSGLGYSISHSPSGRLSTPSELSAIVIPHGSRITVTASGGEEEQEPCGMPDDDKLKALKQELHISEAYGKKTKTLKSGKKRQHPKSSMICDPSPDSPLSSAKKSSKTGLVESLSKPVSKPKRKRGKRSQTKGRITAIGAKEEEDSHIQSDHMTDETIVSSNNLQVVGIQSSVDMEKEQQTKEHWLSKAEERKREIERKRAEKRELEKQRRLEEEEKERLKEELARLETMEEDKNSEDVTDNDGLQQPTPDPAPPTSTPDLSRQHLLDSLRQARIKESHSLMMQRETVAQILPTKVESAENIDRAQEAARKKKAEEEQWLKELEKEKRKMEEKKRLMGEKERRTQAERAQLIEEKVSRLKQECKEAEKDTKRYNNSIAKSIVFSYFCYLPPPRKKSEKKAKRGKRPQVIRPK